MRIVVTGGLGFIGQNFAHVARAKRNDLHLTAVDWLDDPPDDDCAAYDHVLRQCFANPNALRLAAEADVIVHLAAHTTVQESIRDPQRTFDNNVLKTQRLLEYLRLHNPKAFLVFASTGGAIIGDHDGPIDETVPANPLSPYGASKLAVEGMLSAYHGAFGLQSVSLRFANVYGPRSRHKSSLVAQFCKSYLQHNRLHINGDGHQTRDFVFVDDIAEAIWNAIHLRQTGTFQLGTGAGTSVRQIADHFATRDASEPPELRFGPPLSGEVRHNCANIRKAQDRLNFNPAHTLAQGIEKTLDWFERESSL